MIFSHFLLCGCIFSISLVFIFFYLVFQSTTWNRIQLDRTGIQAQQLKLSKTIERVVLHLPKAHTHKMWYNIIFYMLWHWHEKRWLRRWKYQTNYARGLKAIAWITPFCRLFLYGFVSVIGRCRLCSKRIYRQITAFTWVSPIYDSWTFRCHFSSQVFMARLFARVNVLYDTYDVIALRSMMTFLRFYAWYISL